MTKNTKQIPYYRFKGNYKEIGEFLGSTFRKNIQESINKRRKEIVGYDSYLPKSGECLNLTKRYFPNLIVESEAIAKAADVPFLEYFFINNREVYDPAEEWDKKHSVNPDHCTVVVGFNDDGIIVGHNEDWSIDAIDQTYILEATIGEVTFIGLNYTVGVPGLSASMNNYGLVQCINDVYQTNQVGVPKNYIARAVLEAKTLEEAENLIKFTKRASGFNHVLAQGSEVRNIEIAGDEIGVQKIIGKPYVHTNHYLTEELKKFEKFHTISSEQRYIRANELLKNNLTKNDIQMILSDTENEEYPICRSDETIGSAIFTPSQLKSYFCYGHPCAGTFIEYSMKA